MVNITGIVLSLLIICSPATLSILSYRFLSISHFISIFASVLCAYVFIKRYRYYRFMCVFLMILSLSVYQTYISITLYVLLAYYIYSVIKEQSLKLKDVIEFSILFMISLVLYRICWKVVVLILKVDESYNGYADNLNILNMIANIPYKFINSYKSLWNYMATDKMIIHNAFKLYAVETVLVILILINIIIQALYKIKDRIQLILLIIVSILIPASLCIETFFISLDGVNAPSTFPYSLFLPILLCIVSHCEIVRVSKLIILLTILTIHTSIYQLEVDITTMWESRNSCISIMNNVISRLDKKDLYNGDYEYVFFW